eukprot:1759686-Rhodomonas_salina.1
MVLPDGGGGPINKQGLPREGHVRGVGKACAGEGSRLGRGRAGDAATVHRVSKAAWTPAATARSILILKLSDGELKSINLNPKSQDLHAGAGPGEIFSVGGRRALSMPPRCDAMRVS